jgi:hypothetical protein
MLNEIRGYWREMEPYQRVLVSLIIPLFLFAVYVFWTVIAAVTA